MTDFPIPGMEDHTEAQYWHAYEKPTKDDWEFALAPNNVDVPPEKEDGWVHVKTFDHMPTKVELLEVENRHPRPEGHWEMTDKGRALLKELATNPLIDIESFSIGWDQCEQWFANRFATETSEWLDSIFKGTDGDE